MLCKCKMQHNIPWYETNWNGIFNIIGMLLLTYNSSKYFAELNNIITQGKQDTECKECEKCD